MSADAARSTEEKHAYWPWTFLLVAAASGFLFLTLRSYFMTLSLPSEGTPAGLAIAATADKPWFFMVRIPEVSQQSADLSETRKKFADLLTALRENGYKPALLSDVLKRIQMNQSIPKRTVVLAFDPGYRQTYETYAPVLREHGVPALWITDKSAISRAHMGYLSRHQLSLMQKSANWDVGMKDASKTFALLGDRYTRQERWSFSSDPLASNAGVDSTAFNRLNVNAEWSAKDFINRLEAEVPITKHSALTVREIQGSLWGVAVPYGKGEAHPPFNLATREMKRFQIVSWLGTRGARDFQLNVEAQEVAGELWIYLHAQAGSEDRLAVGVTGDGLFVEGQNKGVKRMLAKSPAVATGFGPLKLTIQLYGTRLRILDEQETDVLSIDVKDQVPDQGIVQLLIYDKVRQAAMARGLRAIMTTEGLLQG